MENAKQFLILLLWLYVSDIPYIHGFIPSRAGNTGEFWGSRQISKFNIHRTAVHVAILSPYTSKRMPTVLNLVLSMGREGQDTQNNIPEDIAELNRLLEERAAASRREQEDRLARRPPPRRPDVRMPATLNSKDHDGLWMRLPTAVRKRYRPLRVLGHGAFGEVVLVADSQSVQKIEGDEHAVAAIKIVRARAGGEEPLLLREGVVLSLLPGPPHSPRCIEFGVCQNACFFIVE